MIQAEMRQMMSEKSAKSDVSASPPLSQSGARNHEIDSRRMLGSLLKPLAPNDKEMKRSPSAPVPLPEGRPPTLRQSGSSALISSNGAIKASPPAPKRFDFELKTAWGDMPAKDLK